MPGAASQFPDEQNAEGQFARQEDAFRDPVSTDDSTPYPAKPGRYHLYVSFACPWAHRALIVHHLKNLEEIIGVTVVDPVRDDNGRAFRDGPGHSRDSVENFRYLREAYLATDPDFRGRRTVPVLWDKVTRRIVNNSKDDLCRMFNSVFAAKVDGVPDLFPDAIATEQTELSARIYEDVNNGVYRAGFATTQANDAVERSSRGNEAGFLQPPSNQPQRGRLLPLTAWMANFPSPLARLAVSSRCALETPG